MTKSNRQRQAEWRARRRAKIQLVAVAMHARHLRALTQAGLLLGADPTDGAAVGAAVAQYIDLQALYGARRPARTA